MSTFVATGAAGEVTGSGHLIKLPNTTILLDCGLFQGRRQESDAKNRHFPFDPRSIDTVIISHAHLDHVGRLPLLVKGGFRGQIVTTLATRELTELILLDSAHIQVQDAEFAAKHHFTDQELHAPLYTPDDIPAVMRLMVDVPYEWQHSGGLSLPGNVNVRFFDAGHILGSATTLLTWTQDGQERGLVYTGDLGRYDAPLLRDPDDVPGPAATLIMEATYGSRRHHPVKDVYGTLIALIKDAITRKSKIVVPAFSLGRTQELIYLLHLLTDEGQIPRIPIVVDSPLAGRINDVFMRHQALYDQESKTDFPRHGDTPLKFSNLRFTHSVDESKALNQEPGPLVIISASGMAAGGRVTHHLRQVLPDPSGVILMTGYQAAHTPGRRLLNGAPYLRLHGTDVPVRATIRTINDLSAHADVDELIRFPRSINGLERVILVHAEPDRAEALTQALKQVYPHLEVTPAVAEQSVAL